MKPACAGPPKGRHDARVKTVFGAGAVALSLLVTPWADTRVGAHAAVPKGFRAYDKLTGDIVFEFKLPANQSGIPMTYMVNGRQFIVVPVGAQGVPAEFVALAVS
jgi:hypothetical protein